MLDGVVGGNKANSQIDRALIADTAFAIMEPGATPRFATADPDIYNSLARRAVNPKGSGEMINQAKLGKSVPVIFSDGFDVTIGGNTIRVLPFKR